MSELQPIATQARSSRGRHLPRNASPVVEANRLAWILFGPRRGLEAVRTTHSDPPLFKFRFIFNQIHKFRKWTNHTTQ